MERDEAVVIAEARGTIPNIPLRRTGGTGDLRMSLQVHDDPSNFRTRLGYYGELYLARPGQQEERHIGFLSAWRISRSSAWLPDGAPIYIREWLRSVPDHTADDEVRTALRALMDENGDPRSEVISFNPVVWAQLNDMDSDVIFFPMIWISASVSGQGIISHAFNLFYRLLTGGTLPAFYNVSGPITVALEPGIPNSPEYSRLWREIVTRHDHESGYSYELRCLEILERMYERNGYKHCRSIYDSRVMARVVEPVARDPGDRLMMPPDPPPLAEAGRTPPSSQSRPSPPRRSHGGPLGNDNSPTPGPSRPPVVPPGVRTATMGKSPQIRPPVPRKRAQGQNDYEWDDIYNASP
ncbi:hypothetical protein VM1G_08946 [Cytospora mali]|uniref:Uncharacterized protein n=1 Tax=Cytospora mali TaxID=578113 RepID=A0A194WAT3_CYTMA|nr:hypothetical protein VM1G_08946 [Valsa mali]